MNDKAKMGGRCVHHWVDTGDRKGVKMTVDGMEDVTVRHAKFLCRKCGSERWLRDEIPELSLGCFVRRLERILKKELKR